LGTIRIDRVRGPWPVCRSLEGSIGITTELVFDPIE
jgi:hypothetical protein